MDLEEGGQCAPRQIIWVDGKHSTGSFAFISLEVKVDGMEGREWSELAQRDAKNMEIGERGICWRH